MFLFVVLDQRSNECIAKDKALSTLREEYEERLRTVQTNHANTLSKERHMVKKDQLAAKHLVNKCKKTKEVRNF